MKKESSLICTHQPYQSIFFLFSLCLAKPLLPGVEYIRPIRSCRGTCAVGGVFPKGYSWFKTHTIPSTCGEWIESIDDDYANFIINFEKISMSPVCDIVLLSWSQGSYEE
jgi:hypothetical protein